MAAPSVSKLGAQAVAPRAPKWRRQIIVNRAFQMRTLRPILVYTGLVAVLAAVLVFLPMHRQAAADPDPRIQAVLDSELFRIELWLTPLLLLSGCIAGLYGLFRSNRLAGPLYRLQRALAALASGKYEALRFRRRDELRELEPVFAEIGSRMKTLAEGRGELLRFLRRNVEGLLKRAEANQLSTLELRESLQVILRDIDSEIEKTRGKA